MRSPRKPALLAAIFFAGVATVNAKEVKIPETIAGKRASAYVKAYNAGEDAMRAFEKKHRSAAALESRSTEDRIEQYSELSEDWGTLKVKKVNPEGDLGLVLIIAPSNLDHWLSFDFKLEENPPHKLVAIRIQGPIDPNAEDTGSKSIDAKMRERVVDRTANELIRAYVFADVGQKMADAIRKNLAEGLYDKIDTVGAFARRLDADLSAICHDKHLGVRPRTRELPGAGQAEHGPRREGGNYGFEKVEVFPGNIGYIKLNGFAGTPNAEPTAAGAMALVANTDALIFDLRQNGGGSPDMINFLCGYLFKDRTHLNTFDNRLEGISQTYSRTDVPGQRYTNKPVYILTSDRTFSAAEEFTYNLKNLKRATVVGQTTGGGAHPVTEYNINKYFTLRVPYARAVNPITKTNWEGVGVIPHVETSAKESLARAIELARAETQPRDQN